VRSVSRPLTLVVPISLYRVGEQLHTVLAGYKRSTNAAVRAQHTLQVGATLHRFMHDHGEHIRAAAGDDWDVVTTVPSRGNREGPHPLAYVLRMLEPLRSQYRRLLEPDRMI
jgi:hypothetical protein